MRPRRCLPAHCRKRVGFGPWDVQREALVQQILHDPGVVQRQANSLEVLQGRGALSALSALPSLPSATLTMAPRFPRC